MFLRFFIIIDTGKQQISLKDSVVRMLAGEAVPIHIGTFSNDMTTFATKDDVLTLLVHLGYLTYNSINETVSIAHKDSSNLREDSTESATPCQFIVLIALKDYQGNLLLAGINYNKKTKKHECVIEVMQK